MTDHDHPTAADTTTETHHEPADAADAGHPGHDAHAAAEVLGPVDVPAWTAGALGVALGLIVAACLVVANRPVG